MPEIQAGIPITGKKKGSLLGEPYSFGISMFTVILSYFFKDYLNIDRSQVQAC
jgi:hypothetical protein